MAVLFITEYARQARDASGYLLPVGEEPALAEQQVAIGAGSLASATFNANTNFVRLHTDAICHVAIAATPTAAAGTSKRLPANATEFFGVTNRGQGSGLKAAVITGV